MRQILILVGVMLCLSVSARAQSPVGASAAERSRSHLSSSYELSKWQFAVGYQFNRINLVGTPFDTNGLNVSGVRYFGRWFGAEAQLGLGFGNTGATTAPPNLTAKSLFVGGGPRLAFRGRGRFEPWAHAIIGVEHFRFSQTASVLGSNTGLAGMVGGGVDFRLSSRVAFRAEGDWLATRFFSTHQRHFQAVTGLVFNF